MSDHKWHRSEWISLIGSVGAVSIVGGWLWTASAKATRWDTAAKKVEDKDEGNDALYRELALYKKAQTQEMNLLNDIAKAVGAKRSVKDAASD